MYRFSSHIGHFFLNYWQTLYIGKERTQCNDANRNAKSNQSLDSTKAPFKRKHILNFLLKSKIVEISQAFVQC